MGYMVLTAMGAVPVIASMANKEHTLQPDAFQSGRTVPLLPSIVGTRNPRVDVAIPIAVPDPTQNPLCHTHIQLTGFGRIQSMQGITTFSDELCSLEHLIGGRGLGPVRSLFHQSI